MAIWQQLVFFWAGGEGRRPTLHTLQILFFLFFLFQFGARVRTSHCSALSLLGGSEGAYALFQYGAGNNSSLSKVLYVETLHSNYTRALTLENLCQHARRAAHVGAVMAWVAAACVMAPGPQQAGLAGVLDTAGVHDRGHRAAASERLAGMCMWLRQTEPGSVNRCTRMALRGGRGGGGSGGLWRDMPPPRPLNPIRPAADSMVKKKAARSAPTGAYGVPVQRPPGYEDDESQESDVADTVTNRRVLARRRRNRERRQRLREHRQREQEVSCVDIPN